MQAQKFPKKELPMTPLPIGRLLPVALIGNFLFSHCNQKMNEIPIGAVPLTISQILCVFNNPENTVCASIH
jgi:hypothetical protein